MKTLSLDIETYSSVNLGRAGVYRYAESPDFDILLLGYSIDHGPVQVVDIACGEGSLKKSWMPLQIKRS